MRIFHHKDVEAKDANEGASKLRVRWLITKEFGAENFAMRLFEMDAGGHSPFHGHRWEHEVFILEGDGRVINDEGQRSIQAGDVIFITPNEKHQIRNDNISVLKFLCLVPYTDTYSQAHRCAP